MSSTCSQYRDIIGQTKSNHTGEEDEEVSTGEDELEKVAKDEVLGGEIVLGGAVVLDKMILIDVVMEELVVVELVLDALALDEAVLVVNVVEVDSVLLEEICCPGGPGGLGGPGGSGRLGGPGVGVGWDFVVVVESSSPSESSLVSLPSSSPSSSPSPSTSSRLHSQLSLRVRRNTRVSIIILDSRDLSVPSPNHT